MTSKTGGPASKNWLSYVYTHWMVWSSSSFWPAETLIAKTSSCTSPGPRSFAITSYAEKNGASLTGSTSMLKNRVTVGGAPIIASASTRSDWMYALPTWNGATTKDNPPLPSIVGCRAKSPGLSVNSVVRLKESCWHWAGLPTTEFGSALTGGKCPHISSSLGKPPCTTSCPELWINSTVLAPRKPKTSCSCTGDMEADFSEKELTNRRHVSQQVESTWPSLSNK
mmetsp:Transcript_40911/g.96177  ORF Transcript_40911/g.96177 Transcript_40911/m.96177 type:complete len:225 (-) Transcript_40911:1771-2445(-)